MPSISSISFILSNIIFYSIFLLNIFCFIYFIIFLNLKKSLSSNIVIAEPCFPALAVLPILCIYELYYLGRQKFITYSTSLKSKPLDAKSVASKTPESYLKLLYAFILSN